jgi:hypothetical protein
VCADPDTLDRVYGALLDVLTLTPAHQQALRLRGLVEAEIRHRQYRSLPLHRRAALARHLTQQLGVDRCAPVPGFYLKERDGRRWWSLAGAGGLVVPVRNLDGQIIALKIRADTPGAGPKYTMISSTRYGGPSAGSPVHVPLYAGAHGPTVRLTEGEIKADVATALTGVLTLSLPGVNMWRKALAVVQDLQASAVLLAFDSDWRSNPQVAHALQHAAVALVKAGCTVHVETWDPACGKGIDDVLAAGHRPERHAAALAFGAGLRSQARAWTGHLHTIPAEDIQPWH